MAGEKILLIHPDSETFQLIEREVLRPAGYEVRLLQDWAAVEPTIVAWQPDLVIAADRLDNGSILQFTAQVNERFPSLPILLLPLEHSEVLAIQAFQLGFAGYIYPLAQPGEVLQSLQRASQRRRRLEEWARQETQQDNSSQLSTDWPEDLLHFAIDRNKLETVLKKIEEGVIIADPDGRLLLVNPAARAAFGLGEVNVAGKQFQDVLRHPDLLEILDVDENSSPRRSEIVLENGRVLNAQLSPILEVGVVLIMQDITHLKELDRIKSDFVNTVSHDLRSPLTAILGYVELLDRVGPVNAQQKEFIHRVQVSVHSITALINDLLDLGRIEAGFDSRNEIVPLNAIILYAGEGLRSRAEERSLSLELRVPEDLPPVLGNPLRLRQMLNNLIGNAIKYTPQGGRVNVQARYEGGQVLVEVADTGPGIPSTDQPYIFDKFYRASNVANDTTGTGLGLAIVKSIIENHRGRIWVDSTPGTGSTFTVVLPIIDREL